MSEGSVEWDSVIEHVSPDFVLNALRFLLEGYKVARDRFKDRKTPDRVEEIVTRAGQAPKANSKQIEQSIAKSLDPSDAAIVTADIELLSLLMVPTPSLDAFDYWGKLAQLVAGLQLFANKVRLFELRGVDHPVVGESIFLRKASRLLPTKKVALNLPAPYPSQSLQNVECLAVLQKKTDDFPIQVIVNATFNQFSNLGDYQVSDGCVYNIGWGQQRHWLRFYRRMSHTHFTQDYQYMLEASEFISIVNALRDDIRFYASEVQADEQKIGPLFAQIEAFAQGVKP